MKSIIKSHDNADVPAIDVHELINNESLTNDNNSIPQACGYDSNRVENITADEAFALQLQQEEYSKGSLIPMEHPYVPLSVLTDDEPCATMTPNFVYSSNQQFTNDEELAAYLQQQEQQSSYRYHRSPIVFPLRQNSDPTSMRTGESDEHEIEVTPPLFRFLQRQLTNNDDNSDEDDRPCVDIPRPYFQLLASRRPPSPEGFGPFFRRFGHRSTRNLQDTDEDFGPEDYEVIRIKSNENNSSSFSFFLATTST